MPGHFTLGRTVAKGGALIALAEAGQSPSDFLCRHANSDWGDVDPDERQTNENALLFGGRLLSQYQTRLGIRLWIFTETDRSVTTLLLPDEYL